MIDELPLGFHSNQSLKTAEITQLLNNILFVSEV